MAPAGPARAAGCHLDHLCASCRTGRTRPLLPSKEIPVPRAAHVFAPTPCPGAERRMESHACHSGEAIRTTLVSLRKARSRRTSTVRIPSLRASPRALRTVVRPTPAKAAMWSSARSHRPCFAAWAATTDRADSSPAVKRQASAGGLQPAAALQALWGSWATSDAAGVWWCRWHCLAGCDLLGELLCVPLGHRSAGEALPHGRRQLGKPLPWRARQGPPDVVREHDPCPKLGPSRARAFPIAEKCISALTPSGEL